MSSIHVTRISRYFEVYGHDCSNIDSNDDCGGLKEMLYPNLSSTEVEIGNVYDLTDDGKLLRVTDPLDAACVALRELIKAHGCLRAKVDVYLDGEVEVCLFRGMMHKSAEADLDAGPLPSVAVAALKKDT